MIGKDKKITTEDINKTLSLGSEKKGFFTRYWWLWTLLIFLAAGVLFFINQPGTKQQINYKITTIEKKDLIVTVSATGNLEPTNTIELGIEVSGTITEVFVDYNDKVAKGETLAKLDTTKLASRVANSKASLMSAKANLLDSRVSGDDAKRELDRYQSLYESTNGNFPSAKEIDKAKTTYARSKANIQVMLAKVSQAEASLKSDEDDLGKAIVVSPIEGIVLDKKIEEGQSVVASMQIPILFILAKDLKKMEVVVSVDEADVGQVNEGQKVTFGVDAYPSQIFDGIIKQVRMNSKIVNGVVTYEALVEVNNPKLLLRPGMTASADIITKVVKNASLIPNTALRFVPEAGEGEGEQRKYIFSAPVEKETKRVKKSNNIWILKEDKVVQVPVTVGESDGIMTELINSDIDASSQIIIGLNEK